MKHNISILILMLIFLSGCGDQGYDYYPKPQGFMRLDFPERVYSDFSPDDCPYQFQVPAYFTTPEKEGCNKDLIMERFNASLFLTYIPIDTNLIMNIEYARKLVYEHSTMTDAIDEELIINPAQNAYGLKYTIKGDAASPYQFYLTDSTNHFLRGALYFNVVPNYDSIRTSLVYLSEDIDNILETIVWK